MAKKKKGCVYVIFNSISVFICLGILAVVFYKFFNVDVFYKNRYPLAYEETVEKYCDLYDVDKYLVQAVIRTESFFKEDAISSKGAIGLMQIMPDTGIWVAEKIKLENFVVEDLFDCEKNIMIGVWYISFLSDKFDGNLDNIIAAYNAGPANVSKWLGQKELSDDGENLDNIPFSETKKYKEKVSSAYAMYLQIYGKA